MELQVNAAEQELLQELLADCQRRLLGEISKADHLAFRTMLREKETILESLMRKLSINEAGKA